MSRADDNKRLMELEEELAGLLRANEGRAKADPDKALVQSAAFGKIASALGITSDNHLWEVLSRLRMAGMFLHQPDNIPRELHAAAAFLQTNAEHPTVRHLVTLQSTRTEDIAALEQTFPIIREEESDWQRESENS